MAVKPGPALPDNSKSGSIELNKPQPVSPPKPTPPPPSPAPVKNQGPKPQPMPKAEIPKAGPPPAKPSIPVRKSPFRFLIPILLIGIVLGLIYLGITKLLPMLQGDGDSVAVTENTEVVYWGLWEPSEVLDDVIQDFEAANPNIKITYVQQSPKDYRERLSTALANGTGPDVFRFHHTWGPMLTSYLTGIPENIMTATEFNNTFYPVAQQTLKRGNEYIGIPLMYEGLGLYYNKTIFGAAGKTPPTTWEELRRTANELTIKNTEGQILQAGVALGTTSNVDNWSDILGLMLLQNAADPAKPNNQLGQDALSFYTIFSKTDQIWDDSLPNSTYAFAIEKTAMMLGPSWRVHEIRNVNADLDFAVVPAPQLPDTNIGWASFWAEGVSKESNRNKQQAAWLWLDYMSQKDTLRRFYTAASQQRLFGEPFSRVDLADQLAGDPFVGAFISQAPTAQSWYLADRTFDNGINDQMIKYYEDAVNAINTGAKPADALLTTEQGVQQVLQQYGLSR